MSTVEEPFMITPGPPGMQLGKVQGTLMSVTRAAGFPPINTLVAPLIIAKGMGG